MRYESPIGRWHRHAKTGHFNFCRFWYGNPTLAEIERGGREEEREG
jgi:hypothetical protein